MTLRPGDKTNFDTLQAACRAGNLALIECKLKADLSPVAVVCAVTHEDNGDTSFVPMARLFAGSPYDELVDPATAAELDKLPRPPAAAVMDLDADVAMVDAFRVAVYGDDWRRQPGAMLDRMHTLVGIRAALAARP